MFNLVEDDVLQAIRMINGEKRARHTEISFIYCFTTENIKGYLNKFNVANKKALTVTASGDHALNLAVLGCHDITCFDINRLAKYYLELKRAMVLCFSREKFLAFFNQNSMDYFDKEMFNYLKNVLRDEVKYFWTEILKNCEENDVKYNLFTYYGDWIDKYIRYNIYTSKDRYKSLKRSLEQTKIDYYDLDVMDLPNKLNEYFDFIFLSNIYGYCMEFGVTYLNFRKLVFELMSNLNEDGVMAATYKYGYFPKLHDEYPDRTFDDAKVIDVYENDELFKHTDALLYYVKQS